MKKEWMENKEDWLFDLAHGNLDENAILKGFLKHYVLQDCGIADVQRDLHFHTNYADFYLKEAMSAFRSALENQIRIYQR